MMPLSQLAVVLSPFPNLNHPVTDNSKEIWFAMPQPVNAVVSRNSNAKNPFCETQRRNERVRMPA